MTPEDGPVVAAHLTHIFAPAPAPAPAAAAAAATAPPVPHGAMKAEDEAPDAGPSRPRRPSHPPNLMDNDDDPSVPPPSTARPAAAAVAMSLSRSASSSHSHAHAHAHLPPLPASPPRPPTPHLDLATYPTPTLLRLLASLLQQIATSNDQLRAAEPEDEYMDEDAEAHHPQPAQPPGGAAAAAGAGADGDSSTSNSGRSHVSRSSVRPSPTTALFDNTHPPASPPASSRLDPAPHVFSASRTSLMHPSSLLSFHARHVPSITIEAYLLRILKYCPTTNEVFLSLLVYFDRMSRLGTAMQLARNAAGGEGGKAARGLAIDSFNVHRLVIAGVTVASKFFSDVFYTNSRYAKVGGLPSHELNQLELQFLLLNDFRLTVPPDEMQRYADRLLGYWEGKEAAAAAAASAADPPPAAEPAQAAQSEQVMQVDSPAASRPAAETLTEGAAEEVAPARRTQTALPEITARGKERDTDEGPNVLPPGTASAPAPAPAPVPV